MLVGINGLGHGFSHEFECTRCRASFLMYDDITSHRTTFSPSKICDACSECLTQMDLAALILKSSSKL